MAKRDHRQPGWLKRKREENKRKTIELRRKIMLPAEDCVAVRRSCCWQKIVLLTEDRVADRRSCCWQKIVLLTKDHVADRRLCCWQKIVLLTEDCVADGRLVADRRSPVATKVSKKDLCHDWFNAMSIIDMNFFFFYSFMIQYKEFLATNSLF